MTGAALWTHEAAATATGGQAVGAWCADGLAIDSRQAACGDLFVALPGARVDGHDFVADVLAAGAAAGMVTRRPDGVAEDAPLLLVGDTHAGLIDLGRAGRARARARVVGVTGSVGKTGTKELLARALGALGTTHASAASHNNDIGVPLTLARLPAEADFAVCELGMNHAGELSVLSRLVRPEVAIVTTVEATHLGNFPDVAAIADAKAEIFEGTAADGAAVLNRDNRYFDRLSATARRHGIGRIIAFGTAPEADIRLLDYRSTEQGGAVRADVAGREVAFELSLHGRHWAMNSLAVLGAVHALDADVVAAAAALGLVTDLDGRGARLSIPWAGGAITLIDESYNASPVAMRAALAVLGAAEPGAQGRRIAVLGDMLELGDDAPAMHRALAAAVTDNGIDLLFAAGPDMAQLFDAVPAPMRAARADSAEALVDDVVGGLRAGDVVMVKGSLGSRMGRIVAALKEGRDAL